MSNELIEQLAEIRKSSGLTQTALAEKLGLPQSSIARLESGNVDTRLSRFVEIARALGYEILLVPKKSVQTLQIILTTPEAGLNPSQTPAYGKPPSTELFEDDLVDSEEDEVV